MYDVPNAVEKLKQPKHLTPEKVEEIKNALNYFEVYEELRMKGMVMNFLINRLDNLNVNNKSFEFIPENIKKEINIYGMIVGSGGEFLVNQKDVMVLIRNSNLKNQIGENMYNALLRKPMMFFLIPTLEEEFESTKEKLDERYGLKSIHLNNFAQAFSLGCWFIKDSCVAANTIYWLNMFNGYNSQSTRDMTVTMSNGTISEICLTDSEILEAIDRMYEIYRYLLPEESKMGRINNTYSAGTTVWNIDKAISTEGNSFARALIILQEARRAGVLSSKIEKYCSVLECLFSINKEHKKNISDITAVYIGNDSIEQEKIRTDMKNAYGVRSDGSHGDNLKYLKENDRDSLKRLSVVVDDYVRRVFRRVISKSDLNYGNTFEEKARVRKYFRELT